MENTNLLVMTEGSVNFGQYPNVALLEIARKYAIKGVDRAMIINNLRSRLLLTEGHELTKMLHDMRNAATQHGAANTVQLMTG